jgi:hypothetical protein
MKRQQVQHENYPPNEAQPDSASRSSAVAAPPGTRSALARSPVRGHGLPCRAYRRRGGFTSPNGPAERVPARPGPIRSAPSCCPPTPVRACASARPPLVNPTSTTSPSRLSSAMRERLAPQLSSPKPAGGERRHDRPGGDAAVIGGGGNSGLTSDRGSVGPVKLAADLRIRSITVKGLSGSGFRTWCLGARSPWPLSWAFPCRFLFAKADAQPAIPP